MFAYHLLNYYLLCSVRLKFEESMDNSDLKNCDLKVNLITDARYKY